MFFRLLRVPNSSRTRYGTLCCNGLIIEGTRVDAYFAHISIDYCLANISRRSHVGLVMADARSLAFISKENLSAASSEVSALLYLTH